MKLIAIGDVHGRDDWKKIVKKEKFDICVFVGDYFDSFDIDAKTQIKNFQEIVKFKQSSNAVVILLTGNHDLHYLLEDEKYSGYQENSSKKIAEVLHSARNQLFRAYVHEDMLFTHAGVTKTWAAKHKLDVKQIANGINSLPLSAFAFERREDYDPSGNNIYQGCMWVRPDSLKEDAIEGYTQVVGHTQISHITAVEETFIMIDAPTSGEYIVLDDKACVVNRIENGTSN